MSKLRVKRDECHCCNGLQWGGEEPVECRDCGGSGFVCITEHDRVVDYPGGPFRGCWPGRFKFLDDQGVPDWDWQPALTKDDLYEELANAAYDLQIAIKALSWYARRDHGGYAEEVLNYLNNTLEVDHENHYYTEHDMIRIEHPDGGTDCKTKGKEGAIECFLPYGYLEGN